MNLKDKNIFKRLIRKYSKDVLLENINNYKFIGIPAVDSAIIDYNDYDEDGHVKNWPNVISLKDLNFKHFEYFGNCVNTVPRVWYTHQMLNVIQNSDLVYLGDLKDNVFYSGDKKCPKYIWKYIEKYCRNGVQNLDGIVAGKYRKENILWIYIDDLDKHFFFDIVK